MSGALLLGLVLGSLGAIQRYLDFRAWRAQRQAEREAKLRAWILSDLPPVPPPSEVA